MHIDAFRKVFQQKKAITVSNSAPFTPWFVEIVIPFFC